MHRGHSNVCLQVGSWGGKTQIDQSPVFTFVIIVMALAPTSLSWLFKWGRLLKNCKRVKGLLKVASLNYIPNQTHIKPISIPATAVYSELRYCWKCLEKS